LKSSMNVRFVPPQQNLSLNAESLDEAEEEDLSSLPPGLPTKLSKFMKTKIIKLKVDKHNGWKAYWWKGFETKSESVCLIEITPGKSLDHQHLLSTEDEYEIILEGKASYKGEINKTLKFGDVIEQKGKSGLIKIKNKGKKPLRILCINRPPWKQEHEKNLN